MITVTMLGPKFITITVLRAMDIRGFVTGLPRVFNYKHVYSLSAIMHDALPNKIPFLIQKMPLAQYLIS